MKSSWFSAALVAAMLALLGVLAALQYVWLGRISDAERERLKSRVQSDARRFAEDFNREIQGVYLAFQIPPKSWRDGDSEAFRTRYELWRSRTVYPDLVSSVYFSSREGKTLRFDRDSGKFESAELPAELAKIAGNVGAKKFVPPVDPEIPAVVIPVYDGGEGVSRIVVRTETTEEIRGPEPEPVGVAVAVLDRRVISERLAPELASRYFAGDDGSAFNVSLTDGAGARVFSKGEVTAADASAAVLGAGADSLLFIGGPLPRSKDGNGQMVVSTSSRFERRTATVQTGNSNSSSVEFHVMTKESNSAPTINVFGPNGETRGAWTVSVQHTSGSLESFVAQTRRRNLLVSFGIVGVLAAGLLFVVVSSQRARTLAQRQIDFVSGVSHEFRTPLAVIYSAGENLVDGVARDPERVARYGNLIKSEGRKLSSMVEQILDFAGARSGRRKYDLQPSDPAAITTEAIEESRSILDGKSFEVETAIEPGLAPILADRQALGQAIQNLIANSVKYSNGSRWIRISAEEIEGEVEIAVEDRGIGISKDDLRQIFEPFYRSRAVVDEQIHGNGLGLSIVRETVGAHGGRVDVKSEPGKGSRFAIRIPVIKR